jgi:hypothetical protein
VLTVSSSPARQFFTIFGVVVAVVGLISLVGWIMRRTSRRMHGPAERAQGKIVGLDTSTPGAMRVPGSRLRLGGFAGFAGSGPLCRPSSSSRPPRDLRSPRPHRSARTRPGRVSDTVTVL